MAVMDKLNAMEEDYHQQLMDLDISGSESDLEKSIGTALFESRGLAKKGFHSKGAFDLYIETEDIDKGLLKEYSDLVERMEGYVRSSKDDSRLAKIAATTSEWFNSTWDPNDDVELKMLFSIAYVGATTGIIGIAGAIIGDYAGTAALIGLGAGSATLVSGFIKETELEGPRFKSSEDVEDTVHDIFRLNYLAQRMIKETDEIDPLDPVQEETFIQKHGAENIRRAKKKVQQELHEVEKVSASMLASVGVVKPELKENYVSTGVERKQMLRMIYNQQPETTEKPENPSRKRRAKQGQTT